MHPYNRPPPDLSGHARKVILLCAGMAELVDAADSKSVALAGVSVRFRLSVPSKKADFPSKDGHF